MPTERGCSRYSAGDVRYCGRSCPCSSCCKHVWHDVFVRRIPLRLIFNLSDEWRQSSAEFFCFQLSFLLVTAFRVPALASAVRRTRDCDVRQTPMPHKGPQVSKRRLVCRPLPFLFSVLFYVKHFFSEHIHSAVQRRFAPVLPSWICLEAFLSAPTLYILVDPIFP
jgi:uncharacterized membrane protein YhaH (DUF805 family)